MKLEKISYKSAVFFGVLSLLLSFVTGLMARFSTDAAQLFQWTPASSWEVVAGSFLQGISTYLGILLMILVYNRVAKKYPISWKVSKK
jgi:hypothetical protein